MGEREYLPEEISKKGESIIHDFDSAQFVGYAEKKNRDLAAEARKSNHPDKDQTSKLFDDLADSDGRYAQRADEAAKILSMRDLAVQRFKYDGSHDPDDQKRLRLIDLAIARKKELEDREKEKETPETTPQE